MLDLNFVLDAFLKVAEVGAAVFLAVVLIVLRTEKEPNASQW